jgi:hypothetical protein
MFTYRLHLADGSDVGEATYPDMVKIGRSCSSAAAGASVCWTSSCSRRRTSRRSSGFYRSSPA